MATQVGTQAPNDIAELTREFKVTLQATNRSPATIAAYMAALKALGGFLAAQNAGLASASVL